MSWLPRAGVGSSLSKPDEHVRSIKLPCVSNYSCEGDSLENEERVEGQDDGLGVRQVRLCPPFFDEARARGSVVDECLVQFGPFVVEELLDNFFGSFVLAW